MRRKLTALGVVVGGLISLFVAAGRGYHEWKGFSRATAEKVVEDVTESLPEEIHDKKLNHELTQVKAELIDRQVAMNLSKRQREQLQGEIATLTGNAERRQRLLAEAYPVLKAAIDGQQSRVKWANQEFALADFQKELDELLAMQDRETRQLDIKRTGLDRLEKSAIEGEQALAEMKRGLEQTEQEVAVLRSRREQSETESQTLDLVASATANRETVASSLNRGVERLKTNVDKLEARNEARRGTASISERQSSNQISRAFNRLESLKAIHDATPAATTTPEAKPAANDTKSIEASKVVIEIQGSNAKKSDSR